MVQAPKEESFGKVDPEVMAYFPKSSAHPALVCAKGGATSCKKPLRVGILLSGGQAPGGHNVITGLLDALLQLSPESCLLGFLNGMEGVLQGNWKELSLENVAAFRNQGGFDLLGSSRKKLETPQEMRQVQQQLQSLQLDGLVIVGGDDSNSNAAHLAEFLLQEGASCTVVGVPKTIDGDFTTPWTDISFGFHTACQVYAELLGNLGKDAVSGKKYYYFVKVMGRSASHIALECALQTHPNYLLLGEEVASQGKTLPQVVEEIVSVVLRRARAGKSYGLILIPEGAIESFPDFQQLLQEMQGQKVLSVETLTESARATFLSLPPAFREQVFLDRDPHGNLQVSKIETERLLLQMVFIRMQQLQKEGKYGGVFQGQPLFYGYEGRCALPSNFDATYSYALGRWSAFLVATGASGYLASFRHLQGPAAEWVPCAIPLVWLLRMEMRKGERRPVVEKQLVDLAGPVFQALQRERGSWEEADAYLAPGPLQFAREEGADAIPLTLALKAAIS